MGQTFFQLIKRLAAESCPNLRKFELPKVNFAAENLIELLDATSVWYIPPILKQLKVLFGEVKQIY